MIIIRYAGLFWIRYGYRLAIPVQLHSFPLTCSVLWMISCYHLLVVSVYIFYDRVENVNSESSFVLSIYHILFVEDNRILQCALDALQNWSEKWLLNVNVENV